MSIGDANAAIRDGQSTADRQAYHKALTGGRQRQVVRQDADHD